MREQLLSCDFAEFLKLNSGKLLRLDSMPEPSFEDLNSSEFVKLVNLVQSETNNPSDGVA